MRVAINTRFLLKNNLEGIGLFTHEVLKILTAQHPDDEFVFFFDRPFDQGFVYGKNIVPVVLPPPARHPFLFYWWFERSVAMALKKYQPDVFLSPDNFLSLRTGVKTVLVTHDLAYLHNVGKLSFWQGKYYETFSPKFNRRADRIVAVSHFTKNDIIKQYGIAPEKITVACNGCDASFRPLSEADKVQVRQRFSEGQPYFFYVGAIHPRKNVHRLIAAFDRFKGATSSPAKLVIAGRFAWQSGEVRTAFEQSAHQRDIHFLGYVPDSELPLLMAGALACTYLSLFEGFGIPILQAMHCEVPVITSNVASMPEVAGKAGLLVDPRSVEEIAGAMQQIWGNAHLRERLVAEGRVQRTVFSWQKAADVVYLALQEAVVGAEVR